MTYYIITALDWPDYGNERDPMVYGVYTSLEEAMSRKEEVRDIKDCGPPTMTTIETDEKGNTVSPEETWIFTDQ